MKVESLDISNIAGIKQVSLKFNSRFNVLCGYNGTGKTTILECIAHSFFTPSKYLTYSEVLTRNSESEAGFFEIRLKDNNNSIFNHRNEVNRFNPDEKTYFTKSDFFKNNTIHLINLRINRYINYQTLNSINKDPKFESENINNSLCKGSSTENFKNWFVNRFLFSGHKDTLNEANVKNLEFAKECFSILNEDFRFSTVKADSLDIMLDTPAGTIYFEYLSSGFKACLSILFTIIKEIEYLSESKNILARDFKGVILIDEPEIHMHPSWQYGLRDILLTSFPNAQFILASHSPHIIQSCEANEIISISNENGMLVVNEELRNSQLNFKGWTIEEILSDIMRMEYLRTTEYKSKVKAFYSAIDNENAEEATKHFNDLDQMLHPSSIERKLFSIDISTLTGGN